MRLKTPYKITINPINKNTSDIIIALLAEQDYDGFNEADLYASESVFIQGVWNNVSSSWAETSGSIE